MASRCSGPGTGSAPSQDSWRCRSARPGLNTRARLFRNDTAIGEAMRVAGDGTPVVRTWSRRTSDSGTSFASTSCRQPRAERAPCGCRAHRRQTTARPVPVSIDAMPWASVRLVNLASGAEVAVPLAGPDAAGDVTARGRLLLELENGGVTAGSQERISVRAGAANAFLIRMPLFDVNQVVAATAGAQGQATNEHATRSSPCSSAPCWSWSRRRPASAQWYRTYEEAKQALATATRSGGSAELQRAESLFKQASSEAGRAGVKPGRNVQTYGMRSCTSCLTTTWSSRTRTGTSGRRQRGVPVGEELRRPSKDSEFRDLERSRVGDCRGGSRRDRRPIVVASTPWRPWRAQRRRHDRPYRARGGPRRQTADATKPRTATGSGICPRSKQPGPDPARTHQQ